MTNSAKHLSTPWLYVFLAVCSVGRVDAQILKCLSSTGEAYYTQVACPPGTTAASAQPSSTDGGSFGIKRIFVGSFSGKQTGGPGKLSTETLKVRVASKGAGYVFAIWSPDKGIWNETNDPLSDWRSGAHYTVLCRDRGREYRNGYSYIHHVTLLRRAL